MKQLYALVCETQRYSAVLDAVIAGAGLLRAEKKLRPHLAKVAGPRGRGGAASLPGPVSAPPRARRDFRGWPLSDARERLWPPGRRGGVSEPYLRARRGG